MPRTASPLLLFLLAGLAAGACAREPADPPPRALHTSGHAEVRVAPDRARFEVAVVTEGDSADAVLAEATTATTRVLEALRGADVPLEELRTRGVRLTPVWSGRPRDAGPDWRPRIRGYRAENRIEVSTAALDAVGRLLARAAEAGANELSPVEFSLEDDGEARATAIRTATARARAEARVLAEAASVTLGPVLEVRLDPGGVEIARGEPGATGARMLAGADFAPVPVEAGEIRVSARVSLRYGIAP